MSDQQVADDELAIPGLLPGDVWGESITKQRAAELEAMLKVWEAEREHGERRGPFDRKPGDILGIQLSGADVFWLAALALADTLEAERIATAAGWLRTYPFLSRVNLDTLHLEGANLRRAHLEGANLSHIHLEGAFLFEAFLAHVNLNSAHLELADLSNANAERIVLDDAHLEVAILAFTQMERASIGGAHLEGASLIGANLRGAYLGEAQMQGARLLEAHLEGADLSVADLGAKQLSIEVVRRLRRLALDDQDIIENLRPASLEEAYLDAGTKLIDSTLSDAQGVSVSLADLRWNGFNLGTIDWSLIEMLGDEYTVLHDKTSRYGVDESLDWRVRGYPPAVRACRQLAVALQAQGMNEEAARFAYRSHVLERKLLWRQAYSGQIELHHIGLRQRVRKLGAYITSAFLNMVSGYGYRPSRSLITYLVVVLGFAVFYVLLRNSVTPALSPLDALVFSITSFHGRGFAPGEAVTLHNPLTLLAAGEAIIGLLIEITFIATFTQRFFAR